MYYNAITEDLRKVFIGLLPAYIGTAHSRAGTKIVQKNDGTPVGNLDVFTAEKLREVIQRHFPNDLVIGEEDERNDAEIQQILLRMDQYQWTVDGLDGTGNKMLGTHSYGAMVARRHGKEILYAAFFIPTDMKIYGTGFFFAANGQGAWEWYEEDNAYQRLHTVEANKLPRRTIMLEGSSKKFYLNPMLSLGQQEATRGSFSSCIAATAVARGMANAVATIGHKPWDGWPIVCLVREAGGVITDHQGRPLSAENCSEVIAAANKEDHAHLLGRLNPKH